MSSATQAFVFGGAGFIGTHLMNRLIASGSYDRIVALDIGKPRTQVAGVEYVHHDIREPVDPKHARGVPADIFNLAAIHTTPGHPEGDYYYTNVLGAVNVCRFANETGSRNITFTSSISIYGPSEAPLGEDSQPAPVSAYGRSKLSAEAIHLLWQSEDAARRLPLVRPAVTYGLYEQGNFTRLSRLLERRAFSYPPPPAPIHSPTHIQHLLPP